MHLHCTGETKPQHGFCTHLKTHLSVLLGKSGFLHQIQICVHKKKNSFMLRRKKCLFFAHLIGQTAAFFFFFILESEQCRNICSPNPSRCPSRGSSISPVEACKPQQALCAHLPQALFPWLNVSILFKVEAHLLNFPFFPPFYSKGHCILKSELPTVFSMQGRGK